MIRIYWTKSYESDGLYVTGTRHLTIAMPRRFVLTLNGQGFTALTRSRGWIRFWPWVSQERRDLFWQWWLHQGRAQYETAAKWGKHDRS